jgi:hypothetical protein
MPTLSVSKTYPFTDAEESEIAGWRDTMYLTARTECLARWIATKTLGGFSRYHDRL